MRWSRSWEVLLFIWWSVNIGCCPAGSRPVSSGPRITNERGENIWGSLTFCKTTLLLPQESASVIIHSRAWESISSLSFGLFYLLSLVRGLPVLRLWPLRLRLPFPLSGPFTISQHVALDGFMGFCPFGVLMIAWNVSSWSLEYVLAWPGILLFDCRRSSMLVWF